MFVREACVEDRRVTDVREGGLCGGSEGDRCA